MSTISTKINDLKALDYITEVVTPDLAIEEYGDDLKAENLTAYVTQVGIASELKKQFDNGAPDDEPSEDENAHAPSTLSDDEPVDDTNADDNTIDGTPTNDDDAPVVDDTNVDDTEDTPEEV